MTPTKPGFYYARMINASDKVEPVKVIEVQNPRRVLVVQGRLRNFPLDYFEWYAEVPAYDDTSAKIPERLMESLRVALRQSHYDENAGVPIGARAICFSVLAQYDDEIKNAAALELGSIFDIPSKWASENCRNPVRDRQRLIPGGKK